MSHTYFRLLLVVWFVVAVSCAAWPIFNGWADWPAQAQDYARWAEYQYMNYSLPAAPETGLLGIGFMLLGASLLFFRIRLGWLLFLMGLLLHAYSKYSGLPTIAESMELGLYAAFYFLAGCVLTSYANAKV